MIELESLRWKNRVLLVFGSERAKVAQIERFAGQEAGMNERALIVVAGDQLHKPDAEKVAERHGIKRKRFCVVLIGRDGADRLTSFEPVEPQKIFDLIDSMPTRQQEIARQREAGGE